MRGNEPEKPSLGTRLRERRRERGLTLDQVERATRIRRRYLEAFEADDYTVFPSPVHARGLLRAYAQYLGLDPAELLPDLDRLLPIGTGGIQPATSLWHSARSAAPLAGLVLLVLCLIGLALFLFGQQYAALLASSGTGPGGGESQPGAPPITVRASDQESPPPSPTPTPWPPTPTPVPTPTPRPSPTPTPTPALIVIEARALGRVWVQAETDGRVVYSGILQAGDERRWVGQQRVFLWVGNAGLLEVRSNGQRYPLGAPGEVVRVTWTAPTGAPQAERR